MNDDEIVAGIKARAPSGPDAMAHQVGQMWPCPTLTTERVRSAELELGFALPELLRRLYLQVGNGGFGPGDGIRPLSAELGTVKRPDETVVTLYASMREPNPDDPAWSWPVGLLPICDWGCAIYSCVDVATGPPFRVVTYENRRGPLEPMDRALGVTHASLSAWFEDWLAGVDLGEAMFEEDPELSRVGINPFTKQPMIFAARKLRGRKFYGRGEKLRIRWPGG